MPVSVVPVLALPGWFVQRTGRGAVRIFSGKELPELLGSRGGSELSAQHAKQIAHQVGQRCRTVPALYMDTEKAR